MPKIFAWLVMVLVTGIFFSCRKETSCEECLIENKPCLDCDIVFVSDRDGNDEIYLSKPDGTNIVRLTNHSASDHSPVWSPDGTRIAFISNRTGSNELYIMNADGSNIVRKTFTGLVQHAAWSPDGMKIAYSALKPNYVADFDIWVIGSASGSPSVLFETPAWEIMPAWSPDGARIALVSDIVAFDVCTDIYLINADGTGFTSLTGHLIDDLYYLYSRWSPNGTKLAITISELMIGSNQHNTKIAVINPDGNSLTIFTAVAAEWTKTAWSGDGSRIAYTTTSGSRKDVAWIAANGSSQGIIVTNGWSADWKH